MKKVLLLLLGLLLIGLLAYFCFQNKVDAIKGSLETSATNTLHSSDIQGVQTNLVGNGFESTSIMQLSGEVNTAEQKEKAGRLVASIAGISAVDNQLQVLNTKTALTPTIPSTEKIDKTMEKLKKSETLPSIPQEKPTLESTNISPYIATIQKDKNNHIVLNGYVDSKQTQKSIVNKASELFGISNIQDNLKIASGQPKSWDKVINLGLEKLKDVDYGELNLHDNNYAFNGFLSSNDAQTIKKDILASANKEMQNYSNYLGGFEISIPEQKAVKVVKTEPNPVETVAQKDTTVKTPKACQKVLGELTSSRKILFEYNKATIKTTNTVLLDKIVETLQACDLHKIQMIEIGGHTDSIGNYDYNQELSQKRANSVKNYLAQHGIDSTKLKAIGYGERHPIVSNMLKSGRAKNRRIEFIIKEVN